MKNVAIIISSLKGGGTERVVSRLTSGLSKEKYNVYLILFDADSIKYPYSGKLIDINLKATNNPIKKRLNFIRRYFKVIKIKEEYNIDVSLSFLNGPNLINIFTKRKDRVIISVRNFLSIQSNDIEKKLIRKYYNKADRIVGVSNLINIDLEKNYNIKNEKLVTIYNPYDLKDIQKQANESFESNEKDIFDKKVIITAGRLDKFKGHWHLIRAFKKINDFDKDTRLVILGEGEKREYLQSLVNDLDLKDYVYLSGFKYNPYKYIARSKIFVLSSLSEGFPNALVEAMSCGIPVVSSDCKSGPREILAPDTDVEYQCTEVEYAEYGILIPVFDGYKYDYSQVLTAEENAMADSILKLIEDKDLYDKYSKKSAERAADFNTDAIMKKWESLID